MELPSAFKFKILELVIKHPNHLARTPYQNRSCIFLSFLKKLCTFSLRSFPEDLLDPKADYSFNNSSDTESLILRIEPLPSISRGNLQSPTNSPVTGVVRPFSVTQNDEKPVTYVEKNRRYDEKETRKKINKSYRKKLKVSIVICYFMTLSRYFLQMILLYQVQFQSRTQHHLTNRGFLLLYHHTILIITKNQDFSTVFHQKKSMATLYVYLNWSSTDQEEKRFSKKMKNLQSYSINFV